SSRCTAPLTRLGSSTSCLSRRARPTSGRRGGVACTTSRRAYSAINRQRTGAPSLGVERGQMPVGERQAGCVAVAVEDVEGAVVARRVMAIDVRGIGRHGYAPAGGAGGDVAVVPDQEDLRSTVAVADGGQRHAGGAAADGVHGVARLEEFPRR